MGGLAQPDESLCKTPYIAYHGLNPPLPLALLLHVTWLFRRRHCDLDNGAGGTRISNALSPSLSESRALSLALPQFLEEYGNGGQKLG